MRISGIYKLIRKKMHFARYIGSYSYQVMSLKAKTPFFQKFLNRFSKGFFFAVYDLSTSGKCGTNYVIPSIRIGKFQVVHRKFIKKIFLILNPKIFFKF
jgi:hypothetical protein